MCPARSVAKAYTDALGPAAESGRDSVARGVNEALEDLDEAPTSHSLIVRSKEPDATHCLWGLTDYCQMRIKAQGKKVLINYL
jgi:hypothetical protein